MIMVHSHDVNLAVIIHDYKDNLEFRAVQHRQMAGLGVVVLIIVALKNNHGSGGRHGVHNLWWCRLY